MSFALREVNGLGLLCCEGLASPHAFSTREGGISEPPFAQLNLGLSAGDDPERVQRNRELFRAAVGWGQPVQTCHQVHGSEVHVAPVPSGAKGDALLSDRPGLPIGVYVADCVPILLEDRRTGAVAAVHAGWRGTALGVVREAVQRMREAFGTEPADCVAAIGPSILACCYQVGTEVVQALEGLPEAGRVVRRGADLRVDLQEANRQWLAACGLGRVYVSGLCTACREDWFFSYRRDGARSGRMLAAIARS